MSATPTGPRVLLRSEQSNGEVSVIETAPPPGAGPRLHAHDFDEAFYVIEGTLTFQLGDEIVEAGPGDLAFAPRGVPHTFANLSDAPVRQLIVCTPAGFERYFARMAAERQGVDPPDWALQPIPAVTTLGPQIDPEVVRGARP
jgi:mannose-6-phosphate isomerase-like protein (cupin superfamily)